MTGNSRVDRDTLALRHNRRTRVCDGSSTLMAKYKRCVDRKSAVKHVIVGFADTAGTNTDENFSIAWFRLVSLSNFDSIRINEHRRPHFHAPVSSVCSV